MPEIDGPTLSREVLARRPTGGPRVLFISGFAEPPYYENAPETRDVPLLIKPFTIDELKAASIGCWRRYERRRWTSTGAPPVAARVHPWPVSACS